MKSTLRRFVNSLIDWMFRRPSPALSTMRLGLACLTLSFGAGWALDVSLPLRDGVLDIAFDSAGATPMFIVYAAGAVGVLLIGSGLIWEYSRYRADQRRLDRKKVVVIETRGLRDASGTPLLEAVPSSLEGHRDHVLVDIRQRVKDGEILVPEAAIRDLVSLPPDLRRRVNGFDRRDITLVYGGLTPVPFTFLTGLLIDDEEAVLILDWDRHAEVWRRLDEVDDGKRFRCSGLENVQRNASEVALAVSVSYSVNADDVRCRVGSMPIVTLNLEGGSPDCHWSEYKQRALGAQFLEAVISLGNLGVGRIHLFLAAQNSVVFRFGRLYDKRNLPEVVVYQFLRSATPPYPWGVLMPVCGIDRPIIEYPAAD